MYACMVLIAIFSSAKIKPGTYNLWVTCIPVTMGSRPFLILVFYTSTISQVLRCNVISKEIQIILSLFLFCHLLLQTKSVPSQPASNVGGLVIHWTGLNWQYIAMTRHKLCIISIPLVISSVKRLFTQTMLLLTAMMSNGFSLNLQFLYKLNFNSIYCQVKLVMLL